MDKMYLVKYCGGDYDNYYKTDIFVTTNKTTATKYVTRFNKLLKKWKEFYKQFEYDSGCGFKWIKKEYVEKHLDRWNSLRNVDKCYWIEIDIR